MRIVSEIEQSADTFFQCWQVIIVANHSINNWRPTHTGMSQFTQHLDII